MRRGWSLLLGGLIVWSVHFFALYAIASILLTTVPARLATLGVTLLCLGADLILFRQARRSSPADRTERWMRGVALSGLAISAVAIIWQAMPALLI